MQPRDLRPVMWRIIRQLGAQGRIFDVLEVRGQLRGAVRRERISDYLLALAAGGYLARVAPDEERLGEGFQLVRDPGAEAPRVRPDGTPIVQGAGREQCWRTMRHLLDFSAMELAITASSDRWTVALGEAQDYADRLARVGILQRGRGPAGEVRYTLAPSRYTGPQPPQVLKSKAIYDPNTGRLYQPDGTVEQGVRR
jgi:hypothetical protein